MADFVVSDGEEIPFEETTHYRVFILKPEGPIKWEGFDSKGNYGRIYENGAETWLSREIIEDDMEGRDISSPGI